VSLIKFAVNELSLVRYEPYASRLHCPYSLVQNYKYTQLACLALMLFVCSIFA